MSRIPPYGRSSTLVPVNLGPLRLIAIDPADPSVEYSPALRLDSAAVSTTRFITLPAASVPILEKKGHERADMFFVGGIGQQQGQQDSRPDSQKLRRNTTGLIARGMIFAGFGCFPGRDAHQFDCSGNTTPKVTSTMGSRRLALMPPWLLHRETRSLAVIWRPAKDRTDDQA